MQRLRDYVGFVVWFAGLGTIVLWAIDGSLGEPLAALSPPLRLLGTLAAIGVFVRLLLIAWRSKQKPPASDRPAQASALRRPHPAIKRIKPRNQFGLRGLGQ